MVLNKICTYGCNYSGNYVISAMYGPLCITFLIYMAKK